MGVDDPPITATLVVFLGLNIYASLFRPRVSATGYAPSNQRQVPVTDPVQPYAFSVPGESWYPVVPNKGYLSRDHPGLQNADPAYRGYVV
ncbi:hypothetical protein JVT61DRAFT_8114 [Boletus reticuloceps]|uniref:Uncharacterized protein n=1 Tax=Boletus reticuloceps TaxID=495285 RepID=A0A8I2YV60_9AGAM|nr:hypothetical protein JVT61DRAFT_8114 [Boletus reticuloceps]